jgi:hypothetical protein
MVEKTTTSREHEPVAPPATGISPLVKAELGKITPSIAARIRAELKKKQG